MTKVTIVRGRAIDLAEVTKIAKALSENGYDVKLLIWDRQNNQSNHNENGYVYHFFRLKAPYNKTFASIYIPIWLIYQVYFLLRDDSSIIQACDLDTLIPSIFVKLLKKVKLSYIIYDFYANNVPDGPLSSIRNSIRLAVASVERLGIGYTDVLFLLHESRRQEIDGARVKNLVYLYNSPYDYIGPKYLSTHAHEIHSPTTILYVGIISKLRGVQHMVQAVRELTDIRLILAGTVTNEDLIKKIEPTDDTIRYIGWIPDYGDVIKQTLDADILFRFVDPQNPRAKYEIPNKLFEAMMCGKPIIVSDGGIMAEMVRQNNCGLIVKYGDISAIKDSIIALKNNPKLYKELSENARTAFEQHYDRAIIDKRLINAYRRIP